MSILISGDFHANVDHELSLVTKKALIKKYTYEKFNKINYHIILGDGGFLWHGNKKTDIYNYKVLAYRSFPVLCVIGNHEPILGKKNIPEVDIGIGEKVYQIQSKPFVAYLKRGKVYYIDGIKFLVLGGALSIDKDGRIPNISWWENEYWLQEERVEIFNLLETNNTFDYVLSHTGPGHINANIKPFHEIKPFVPIIFDEVAALNETIDSFITCKQWFCGHWHRDQYFYDKDAKRSYQYLYRKTALINGSEIEVL